jgi:hypothetical protein
MKTYCGGYTDPVIIDLSISCRRVVDFTPPPLYPRRKIPGTQWIGDRVGPRIGLEDVERRKVLPLQGLELRTLGRPTRSQ